METAALRNSGIKPIGEVPWGTHLCQFYETEDDLIDILVSYFAEGLRSNEFCMLVTSPPLEVEEAKNALRKAVPNLEHYIEKGQIEIISYTDWYLIGGEFNASRTLQFWEEYRKEAMNRGFSGIRVTGEMACFFEHNLVHDLIEYEKAFCEKKLHRDLFPMITICSYNANILNKAVNPMDVYSELTRVHKEVLFSGPDQKLGMMEIRKKSA